MSAETGVVLQVHASRCIVAPDSSGAVVTCRYRGSISRGERRATNVLVVGDRVRFEREGGIVAAVLPRRNELARQASGGRTDVRHVLAANVDQALIVTAVEEPRYRTGFIDRCMAAALVFDIVPLVAFNKVDLAEGEERRRLDEVSAVYRGQGFRCLHTSVAAALGLDELRELFVGRTTVLVGPSGVGKSSLLNALQPGLELATGEISEATRKGRHTTTRSQLLPLDGGGFVVDTPGVRAFGLQKLGPVELALAYPEFVSPATRCRFKPCTHLHEPSCAVREEVEEGRIEPWRFENYRRLVETTDAEG